MREPEAVVAGDAEELRRLIEMLEGEGENLEALEALLSVALVSVRVARRLAGGAPEVEAGTDSRAQEAADKAAGIETYQPGRN